MTAENFVIIFQSCLARMRRENQALLDRKLKEECINAAFCTILREEFSHRLTPHGQLHYDVEYDKQGDDTKWMGTLGSIRPDITIHRRGEASFNFLFIEAKKDYLSLRDKQKLLKALEPPYCYHFAVGLSYLPKTRFSRFCILQRNTTTSVEEISWQRTP